ncbi:DUF3305 domain-containing protein [Thermohalobaculum xanthum]|uniref:DUF3305 domain-containing protein n=1 Tax=Thermohalobaculum xanthum TaxID=2753746 RepID=UPI002D7E5357|nr:DUF3305 domain-containing protein [Thermohalobaculum xanthum]
MDERSASIPLGVVIRRQPGVTRWAKWVWRAVAVLPGAASADWQELRREGEAVEYHAATLPLTVYRSETEAYRIVLAAESPSVFVVLHPSEEASPDRPYVVHSVTVSAHEAQQALDSGEELVEPVPMPPPLYAWLADFVDRHHADETFMKRKRGPAVEMQSEDGKGDARIRQAADVYRSPASRRKGELH